MAIILDILMKALKCKTLGAEFAIYETPLYVWQPCDEYDLQCQKIYKDSLIQVQY